MAALILLLLSLLLSRHRPKSPVLPMLINRRAWGFRFKGCWRLVVSVAPW